MLAQRGSSRRKQAHPRKSTCGFVGEDTPPPPEPPVRHPAADRGNARYSSRGGHVPRLPVRGVPCDHLWPTAGCTAVIQDVSEASEASEPLQQLGKANEDTLVPKPSSELPLPPLPTPAYVFVSEHLAQADVAPDRVHAEEPSPVDVFVSTIAERRRASDRAAKVKARRADIEAAKAVRIRVELEAQAFREAKRVRKVRPDAELFGVDAIVGVRGIGGNVEYLVQWTGYPASWQPPGNLLPAVKAMAREFERGLGPQ